VVLERHGLHSHGDRGNEKMLPLSYCIVSGVAWDRPVYSTPRRVYRADNSAILGRRGHESLPRRTATIAPEFEGVHAESKPINRVLVIIGW